MSVLGKFGFRFIWHYFIIFFYADNISFGGIMRGKDFHDNSEFGDKYSEEFFEELKHANQWRPQANKSDDDNNMDALFFDKDDNKENDSKIVSKSSPQPGMSSLLISPRWRSPLTTTKFFTLVFLSRSKKR